MTWLRNRLAVPAVVVLMMSPVLAGCDAEGDALTTEATALELPGLEGVPLPESAVAIAPAATVDGITTQVFEVTGDTPADVMRFYEDVFGDWTPVVPPAAIGLGGDVQAGSEAKIYRGGWSDGERDVLVTAGPVNDQIQLVQLNVQVGPEGTGVFDFDAATEGEP